MPANEDAPVTLLTPASYRRERWKNGGGWTTELARRGEGDFLWRISIAEIEADGPFSSFPGIDRTLLLLSGNGIELEVDGTPHRLAQRFEQLQFAGEATVQCRLLGGPTRDFNVMARRGAVEVQAVGRPLVGSMLLFPEPGVAWFAYVHAGELDARVGNAVVHAAAHDSLHVAFGDPSGERVILEGSGELVLVRLAHV